MTGAEQTLVVILSGALAVFLVLGIIATILCIQILNHIKRLTEKAESIADKAEAVTSFFQASAGPAALAKLLANIVQAVSSKKKK